jgi:hypothetical protein
VCVFIAVEILQREIIYAKFNKTLRLGSKTIVILVFYDEFVALSEDIDEEWNYKRKDYEL